ncbi:MAG TPA: ImmA/IrrE family metallo-endopeptidase [Puia sp.]|jgi:Zn-dependent peptidase ImmA (M78 family)|nr:ImmA/IrrE family metallo-endopeptidase [Puia sp.]
MPINVSSQKSPAAVAKKILDTFKIKSAPVQVKDLAKNLGLTVIPYDLGEDVSGVLVIENGKGTIGYNPANARVRQRFTISHELGHFMLHCKETLMDTLFIDKDFIVKYRSDRKYSHEEIRHEWEANEFAAELLMPRDLIWAEMVKKEYENLSEIEFIEKLAKVFDVSVPAMTIRANNLDLFG